MPTVRERLLLRKLGVTLTTGDVLSVLPTLAENSFDACLTDPPYGLSFMGKGWDHGVPGVEMWRRVGAVLYHVAQLLRHT